MLASPCAAPITTSEWISEPKMDGIRGLAFIRNGQAVIHSRRGLNLTSQYPVLSANLARIAPTDLVLDGEIIALNSSGQPSFQQLQQRMNLLREADVERAEKNVPVFYLVFDVLHAGDSSLLSVPLRERKLLLQALISDDPQVKILQHFDDAEIAYETCIDLGFEGIVSKRLDSLYESGRRSPSWLKVKAQQTDEFVVGGFTAGQGSRGTTFGALLLGQYNHNDELIYCGSVGSGFDQKLLMQTMRKLMPLQVNKCPFKRRPDEKKQVVWIKPEVVLEAKFMDWTRDRHLRAPVFLRFREDKTLNEVRRQETVTPLDAQINEAQAQTQHPAQESAVLPAVSGDDVIKQVLGQLSGKEETFELIVGQEKVKLTNLSRPFWQATESAPAITKRDYLIFLTRLSPYILPQLSNRPLTVIRATDGVHKKHFHQKHWSYTLPEFVDTATVASGDVNEETIEHVVCNNLAALLYFAQHSVVEFHCMPSRIELAPDLEHLEELDTLFLLNYPDFIVFDLDLHKDGRGAKNPSIDADQFKKLCEIAIVMKDLLESMSLTAHVKTSGRTGLHVVVPIIRNLEFDIVRNLAEVVGRFLVAQNQDGLTQASLVAKSSGKILIDHSPNARGKTVACAYTPRATMTAAVSTPVSWDELSKLSPSSYTIHNLIERLKDTGDIWADFHAKKRDLEVLLNTISR